jgi:drug/metabolite transporter (DMT)-like permease
MTETVAARKASIRGIVLLGVVVLAWGTMWPVNKALLAYMSPIWSIALRTCISVLALFTISLSVTGLARPKRGDAPVLISMVLLHMVGFTILTQLALQFVPAGQSTVLAYTSVLWAPLFAALFLRERLSLRRAVGLGLGVLGLIVIFNPATFDWSDRGAVAGNAAILLAAMLWGASIVHNRGHVWRSTPFQLAPWQALLAAAILTLVALMFEGPPVVQWNTHSALLLLFAGIPGTALAYWAAAVSSS